MLVPALLIYAWLAVHRISGFAPWLADSLRRVIGVEGVARLEEAVYGVEDSLNSVVRRGEKPRAYWEVPPEAAPAATRASVARALVGPAVAAAPLVDALPIETAPSVDAPPPVLPRQPALPHFRPRNVGPMFTELDAPGDGRWVVLADDGSGDPRMYKTLLHPDAERAWAELFVVALDLRRVRLHFVPGTLEPQATVDDAVDLPRPGRVPDEDHAGVLAAFNGGFKTEHGHYGTYFNGVTVVPPLTDTCTIALTKDNTLRIGTWSKLDREAREGAWWRQTPGCMYEDGKINPRLAGGRVSKWGSTIDGETVIRRSAIGVDAAGTTLFVGISNHTTAPAIAQGMRHAGATTIAQLDINFSYPKFVSFRDSATTKQKVAVPLAEGFEYAEGEYLRKPSQRDFFYVMDSSMDGRTARN
ncbi:MAG TPA: phosphodiester glycosidase family protein [Polyangiaceae bacterium]|nr:phosphodiester glycosidase family protein [Polyangiaceae bacterium]